MDGDFTSAMATLHTQMNTHSQNPTSNMSIEDGAWTHVRVVVNTSTGGEFFLNEEPAGLIDVNDSQIPAGDFGSNDCFQSGEDCDELYIGRMGAGCDCNYFHGLLDDVRIGNNDVHTLGVYRRRG